MRLLLSFTTALLAVSQLQLAARAAPAVPVLQVTTSAGSAKSGTPFLKKVGKFFTPKPASYHGNKAVAHLAAGSAKTLEAVGSPVIHSVKGVAGGVASVPNGLLHYATGHVGKGTKSFVGVATRPIAGAVGGTYLGVKAGGRAAADFGQAVYHGTSYPVAKLHEAVRGKPRPEIQRQYSDKFAKWAEHRADIEKAGNKDHKFVSHLTVGGFH